METTLQQIIARVPEWASAQSIQTSVLMGGITNQNYRVDVDGTSFVVRVTGKDSELLGINRQHEYECSVIAAETGVAPEVLHFFPDLGSIVTRFIDGHKIPPNAMGTRENIARVATAVRRLHRARPYPGAFSPFRAVQEYRRNAERLGAPMPSDIDELFRWVNQIEATVNVCRDRMVRRALHAHHAGWSAESILSLSQDVSCHNDLLNENFLDDGNIRIIDFEYAAMGDPFFDLGNFAAHHQFDGEQDAWLIESYFGAGRDVALQRLYDESFARLQLMKTVSDLREALWGVVQIKLSSLDFDYRAYADEFFGRYREKWSKAKSYVARLEV